MYIDNNVQFEDYNFVTDNVTIHIDNETFDLEAVITIDENETTINRKCETLQEAIEVGNLIIQCIDSDWELTQQNLLNNRVI